MQVDLCGISLMVDLVCVCYFYVLNQPVSVLRFCKMVVSLCMYTNLVVGDQTKHEHSYYLHDMT